MRSRSKTAILLFTMVFVVSSTLAAIDLGIVESPVIDDEIQVSAVGDREAWFDNRWHNRKFINVVCKLGAPIRRGRVVKYLVPLDDISNLDPNSIRLLLNGLEIPFDFEFDPVTITGIITFVVDELMGGSDMLPELVGGVSELQYTLYYDSVPNGLKPVPDYDPTWATTAVQAYENGSAEQQAYTARDQWFIDNGLSESDNVYRYNNETVTYDNVTGNFYYENGSQVLGYIVESEVLNMTIGDYYYVAPDGSVYQVQRVGDQWEYTLNGSFVGDANTLNKIYTYKTEEVFYDPATGRWEYLNNSILMGYSEFDNATNYYYYYAYNDTNSSYYINKTAIIIPAGNGTYVVTAMFDNITQTLYVYNETNDTYVTVPYDILNQTVYLNSSLERGFLDALTLNNGTTLNDWEIGNVELVGTGSSNQTYTNATNDTSLVTETFDVKAYRGSPTVLFNSNITSEQEITETMYGSALFNLDGVLEISDGTTSEIVPYDQVQDWLNQRFWDLGIWNDLYFLQQAWLDEWARAEALLNDWIVVTEGYSFNLADLDFTDTGLDWYDMTGVLGYDTGNPNAALAGDYRVRVIPTLFNPSTTGASNWIGLYNMRHQNGIGMKLGGIDALTNILLETWEEYYTDPITFEINTNIYVNISFNYVDWWYTTGSPYLNEQIWVGETNQLYGALSYLEGLDPIYMLDSLLEQYDTNDLNASLIDRAIPISVTINSPTPGVEVDQGSDLEIDITVTGETLAFAQYKISVDGVLMDFDEWNEIWVGNGDTLHQGRRCHGVKRMENIGEAILYVLAYDTSGTVVLAEAPLIVNGALVEEWTWTVTIGSVSTILTLLGLATVKNKKLKKGRGCLDGKCDL